MKISRLVAMFSLAIATCSSAAAAPSEGEPEPRSTLRPIPGVTAPDQFPRGCVDCHINRPDMKMDVRISTLMRQWQEGVDSTLFTKVRAFTPAGMALRGRHPKVAGALANIPTGCLKCHSRASKSAPPFGRLLHGLHLVGGEKNHFLSTFQGECTHCHKLSVTTGSWSLGTGKEK